ncbi:unnamed protein product, partial [marine sediment metagenome]
MDIAWGRLAGILVGFAAAAGGGGFVGTSTTEERLTQPLVEISMTYAKMVDDLQD